MVGPRPKPTTYRVSGKNATVLDTEKLSCSSELAGVMRDAAVVVEKLSKATGQKCLAFLAELHCVKSCISAVALILQLRNVRIH